MCPPRRKISNIEALVDKKNGDLKFVVLLEDGEIIQLKVPGFIRGSGVSDLVSKANIVKIFERLAERQSKKELSKHGLESLIRKV